MRPDQIASIIRAETALAFTMYVSDTGFFPSDGRQTLEGGWIPRVLPYLHLEHLIPSLAQNRQTLSNTVISCPGFNRIPGAYERYSSTAFGYNIYGSATAVDSWGLVKYGQGQLWTALPESGVVNPSQMIALGDCQLRSDGANAKVVFGHPLLLAIPWKAWEAGADKFLERRHRGKKWNIAMVDSHIETQRGAELFDFDKPSVRVRWNRDARAH